jgi:prepilin-type N-terminal cleavage/methylation domain-containing protein
MDRTAQINKSQGFTLVEMLIGMAVIVVLMTLSASGYMGLRTTMILKQSTENLRSDIMYAKRASMLVKRADTENWVKGVGLDLASLHGDEPGYRIFKWCSDDVVYEDFDDSLLSSIITGLPSSYYGDCESIGTSQLAIIPGYNYLTPTGSGMDFKLFPSDQIRFIFFESPTGEIHFYDCDGVELDYDQPVSFYYQLGSRAYELEITTNGEINIEGYDGEVPDNTVCNGEIDLLED